MGAIPSAIILLIVDPWYALAFVIFILILQQIDGNIVMPKIVGLNIGMSAFWVLFSLILFGGLFGFWGMLLGVPVFTIIYSLITAAINNSLEKKGIPRERYLYPKDPFTSVSYTHLDVYKRQQQLSDIVVDFDCINVTVLFFYITNNNPLILPADVIVKCD